MTWRFALIIEPVASDDPRTDFDTTFAPVDASAPALSIGELSTQRGDGIFESIGVVDRHPQEVEAHLARLAHSAEICDLPVPKLA
ncbi:4-amino-4-deoxychorismate lyase [Microbacterium ginsengisoli]|uniref:4-amino-4-deoxychorismate lyase n=2 Tax=Microbacterium TaxID=33882 RepID=A0A0F0LZX0_9MICO|nr:4-amino-4-deoxychorismate lyase [Microbacterium ginsengisoli]